MLGLKMLENIKPETNPPSFRKLRLKEPVICEGHRVAEIGLESSFLVPKPMLSHVIALPPLVCKSRSAHLSFTFSEPKRTFLGCYFFHSYLSERYSAYSLVNVLEFPLESNLVMCIKILIVLIQ